MTNQNQVVLGTADEPLIDADYANILKLTSAPNEIFLVDHLNGFDVNLNNDILGHLNDLSNGSCAVRWSQVVVENLKFKYPNLQFKLNFYHPFWDHFKNYRTHPIVKFKNFICSFNGSPHVSRKLLVSALRKFDYFNPDYCSKNFIYSQDVLDGHIQDFTNEETNSFYRKFFMSNDNNFNNEKYIFGNDCNEDHVTNIYNLENKLTQSFLHVVSETMATSYHPFITEKSLYSLVTRGLFLAWGQPGWHAQFEKYGFKNYTKLFDYRFDTIKNPVERLIELLTMISKFKNLSADEWNDLYLLEYDAIEYNYEHYFSSGYLKYLKKYCD